jgi:cellulose synthase/poly-beta-1,6-N-acetylglucosamine synthase-like glycosyltransferase
MKMVARFNGVSMWVTTNLVEPEEIKQRVKVFKKMVAIGKYLLELNSLNALMAVIAGWNNSSVLRLKYLFLSFFSFSFFFFFFFFFLLSLFLLYAREVFKKMVVIGMELNSLNVLMAVIAGWNNRGLFFTLLLSLLRLTLFFLAANTFCS